MGVGMLEASLWSVVSVTDVQVIVMVICWLMCVCYVCLLMIAEWTVTGAAVYIDERWRDLILFYEYYNPDSGRGLGARSVSQLILSFSIRFYTVRL